MERLIATCLVITTLGACAADGTSARARAISFCDGITIRPASRTVEVQAWTCRDSGAIIQVACAANTREHESLVAVAPQPSEIRAALRAAGFAEGSPGVRREPAPGQIVEVPISDWVRCGDDITSLPGNTWIFGGSHLTETPAWVGGEAQLAADLTGSVIGLATFGDEVLGFPQGFTDPSAGDPVAWSIRTPHVPPIGTPVTLLLRPAAEGG
jgi:hypothetical protein